MTIGVWLAVSRLPEEEEIHVVLFRTEDGDPNQRRLEACEASAVCSSTHWLAPFLGIQEWESEKAGLKPGLYKARKRKLGYNGRHERSGVKAPLPDCIAVEFPSAKAIFR